MRSKNIKYFLLIGLWFFGTALLLQFFEINSFSEDAQEERKSQLRRFVGKKDLTKEEVSSGNLLIKQDDGRIIRYIQKNHLTPPSSKGSVDITPAHQVGNRYEQQEVYRFVIQHFENKSKGVFIECGANDGEFFSNTLPLEINHGWTGLLIEADPRPLKKLLRRNRQAWIASACLSTFSYPMRMEMLRHDTLEGISFFPGRRKFIGEEKDYYGFEAQCFPLYSILLAVNMTTIDYFSLDIEGAELEVLKTIPWDMVLIKMLSIEVHPEYVEPVLKYMESIGYKYIRFIQNGYSHDQIFVHGSLANKFFDR